MCEALNFENDPKMGIQAQSELAESVFKCLAALYDLHPWEKNPLGPLQDFFHSAYMCLRALGRKSFCTSNSHISSQIWSWMKVLLLFHGRLAHSLCLKANSCLANETLFWHLTHGNLLHWQAQKTSFPWLFNTWVWQAIITMCAPYKNFLNMISLTWRWVGPLGFFFLVPCEIRHDWGQNCWSSLCSIPESQDY